MSMTKVMVSASGKYAKVGFGQIEVIDFTNGFARQNAPCDLSSIYITNVLSISYEIFRPCGSKG